MKTVIDLMVEAATKKELMDKFRDAKSETELYEQLKHYSIGKEDCKKLFDGRNTILGALKDYERRGCY